MKAFQINENRIKMKMITFELNTNIHVALVYTDVFKQMLFIWSQSINQSKHHYMYCLML